MWSSGALLELDDRAKIEQFLMKHESKLNYPKLRENETIFEYLVNESGKRRLVLFFSLYRCIIIIIRVFIVRLLQI